MRCSLSILTLLATLMAAAPSFSATPDDGLPENVFAFDPEDAVQDVVFLADGRPLFMRLSIILDGNGYQVAWGNFVARLHQYLDANDDHTLSVKEAQRGNWQQQLLTSGPNRSVQRSSGRNAAVPTLDPNKDGKVSVAELTEFLRNSGFAPCAVQASQMPDNRGVALFGQLDTDHDGKLSSAELADTDRCMLRLDVDEDDLLALAELRPFENPYASQFRGIEMDESLADPDRGPLVSIVAGEPIKKLARRLITKYDRPERGRRDHLLSLDELGVAEAAFRKADADADSRLSAAEIEVLLARPPVEMALEVSVGSGRARKLEPAPQHANASPALAAQIQRGKRDTLFANLEGCRLTLELSDNLITQNEFFREQFKNSDTDKNRYIDQKESQTNGVFGGIFDTADRDGDGKLFEKELTRFLQCQKDALECHATVSVSDAGRALFDLLDINHDQHLSIRELRGAGERLKGADRNADKLVSPGEVPRELRLAIGRGQPPFQRGVAFEAYSGGPSVPSGPRGASIAWFHRMDRNGDGDLSLREFLGPREHFLLLDADHDGLISADEAAKGP